MPCLRSAERLRGRGRRLARWTTLAAFLGSASAAFADDVAAGEVAVEPTVSASGVSTTIGEWRVDNQNGVADDDYGVVLERFNLGVQRGELSSEARIDVALFGFPPDAR